MAHQQERARLQIQSVNPLGSCAKRRGPLSEEIFAQTNIIWDIDEYLLLMDNSLEISAPNLKYLEWDGSMMNRQHLAKLKLNVVTHLRHYLCGVPE